MRFTLLFSGVAVSAIIGCAPSAIPPASSTAAPAAAAQPEQQFEILSKTYEIDRIYRSMQGPASVQKLRLLDSPTPELVWITGCHVEMVGADGQTPMPPGFMCHANLDYNPEFRADRWAWKKELDGRFFTLSQGQLEVKFPPGFGIPLMSDEELDLGTQVLNHNLRDARFAVRHRVRIDFVRDRDLATPLRPLYEQGINGLVSLENEKLIFDFEHLGGDDKVQDASWCLPGRRAAEWNVDPDKLGRRFTGHWIVAPGREENHTRVTTLMDLPFDTTIHYIAVHLHPFAESLELRDVTTKETLFKSRAQNSRGEIGLVRVDSLGSEPGIPVYQDHEYELVSVYNNTSADDQDSMAVMYLYLLDQEFRKPTAPAEVGSSAVSPAATSPTAADAP